MLRGPPVSPLTAHSFPPRRSSDLRNLAVEMIGAEGDVEMVAAGQAVLRDVDKRPAHHTAQGVFHHAIVSQTVAAHFLGHVAPRSEEHTSELQSLMRITYAVFCLTKKRIQQHNS